MKSQYGYCPACGAPGRLRERRPGGNDTCENRHVYPSRDAIRVKPDLSDALQWARALLCIHGFITEPENAKVIKRLERAGHTVETARLSKKFDTRSV